MTVFDALLVLVLAVSIFFATVRGAIRETATILALAAGGLAAFVATNPMLALLGKSGSFFASVIVAAILGLTAFFAAYVLFHKGILRLKLSDKMRRADQIGGGALGLLRALALIGLGFLGYGYYLDDKNQPDAVRKALLLPVATASAKFFEQFAPNGRALDGGAEAEATNAAREGYNQIDRTGLREIVTTVTTTDKGEAAADPIADILAKETTTDGEPNRR